MTLPGTGSISMSQINIELDRSSTAQISLSESAVRELFGKASGAISMSDGRGKSSIFRFTISGSLVDVDIRNAALAAGWNGTAQVEATIASGAVMNASFNDAVRIHGHFPNGVVLINNGIIAGRGGNGGAGGAGRGDQGGIYGIAYSGSSGGSGGTGLAATVPVTIFNYGTIAGGGGGGGGGGATIANQVVIVGANKDSDGSAATRRRAAAGGGGGGAGRGNNFGNSGGAGGVRVRGSTLSIGSGLTITNAQAGGGSNVSVSGGGGLRGEEIDPGDVHARAGGGGSGGFWGAAGGAGGGSNYVFPSANSRTASGGGGGAAGLAIWGNNNITWGATGTRYGGIAA